MGRKKIKIAQITENRNKQVTFTKRKNGLYKKLMELSILCNASIGLIMFNESGKLYEYSSDGNLSNLLQRYSRGCGTMHETRTNADIFDQFFGDKQKRGEDDDGGESSGDAERNINSMPEGTTAEHSNPSPETANTASGIAKEEQGDQEIGSDIAQLGWCTQKRKRTPIGSSGNNSLHMTPQLSSACDEPLGPALKMRFSAANDLTTRHVPEQASGNV